MTIGDATRAGITSAINSIGSTIVMTPYTQSTTDSGYSGQIETDGTSVTEIAIPFEELMKLMKMKFGDVETGEFQLALKYTSVFDISGDTKYKVTYQGKDYDFTKTERFILNDVLVAWIVSLSKRID